MLSMKIDAVFLILIILQLSKSQRRISSGQQVQTVKSYVVYLSKADKSVKNYDYWICGGAIVSKLHIITSAACVQDVQHMYVIPGYAKYVPNDKLEDDICSRELKKKIIYTCVPKSYELDYAKIEKWAYIDIAVAKVDSEFDFNDTHYEDCCSYKPSAIEINYFAKYQEPNADAIVFGWGHAEEWRKPEDNKDYNQKMLHYATALIQKKEICKNSFANFPQLLPIIDKYMICTNESGNLDEKGHLIKPAKLADGCSRNTYHLRQEIECDDDYNIFSKETRRSDKNVTTHVLETQPSRKQGICQNDHGGPLVRWIGSKEMLIGVASVFGVTKDNKCTGPYLFTSTQCNSLFLDCVINENKTRRTICDKPPIERGFDKIEKHISWMNHPDGPAANEVVRMRPQRPIRTGRR